MKTLIIFLAVLLLTSSCHKQETVLPKNAGGGTADNGKEVTEQTPK